MKAMRVQSAICAFTLLTAIGCASEQSLAQYDKDGRYVPSPGGVPADPYKSTVPTYPGTPGGTSGTPALPRSAYPPALPPMVLSPRPSSPPTVGSSLPRPFVPLTIEQCDDGWSRSTHLTPVEFRHRCALLLKQRAQGK
jgi:hypothetical protein